MCSCAIRVICCMRMVNTTSTATCVLTACVTTASRGTSCRDSLMEKSAYASGESENSAWKPRLCTIINTVRSVAVIVALRTLSVTSAISPKYLREAGSSHSFAKRARAGGHGASDRAFVPEPCAPHLPDAMLPTIFPSLATDNEPATVRKNSSPGSPVRAQRNAMASDEVRQREQDSMFSID